MEKSDVLATLVIKTTNGEIRCTGNHLVRTDRGWVAAKDVKEGVKILSPVNVDAAASFTSLARMDASADLLQDTSSNKSLPVGLQQWDTQSQQNFIQEAVQVINTTTFGWAQAPVDNGWLISNSTPSPPSRQWLADIQQYSIPTMEYKFGNGRICSPRWS